MFLKSYLDVSILSAHSYASGDRLVGESELRCVSFQAFASDLISYQALVQQETDALLKPWCHWRSADNGEGSTEVYLAQPGPNMLLMLSCRSDLPLIVLPSKAADRSLVCCSSHHSFGTHLHPLSASGCLHNDSCLTLNLSCVAARTFC